MKQLSATVYVWAWRGLVALALLAVALSAVAVIALRYWILPDIGRYRADIAAAVSEASGQRVTIGSIAADWHGVRPHLSLGQVTVFDQQGRAALAFDRVEATLSWQSPLAGEIRLHRLELKRPKLVIRREADGLIYISDIAVNRPQARSGFAEWLLRQEQIVVSHGEVAWHDRLRQAPALALSDVGFRLENGFGERHRFGLVATPPAALASRIDIRGDLRGESLDDLSRWRGRLYAGLGYTDIAAWAAWIDFPYVIRRGTGGIQAWLDIEDGRVAGVTADLGLSGVRARLAKSLPELDLRALSGRLAWREMARGFEAEARRLAVDGPQISFPAASLSIRFQAADARHAEEGRLRAEGIALEPLVQLAEHLPLAARQREVLRALEPRGLFKRASFDWEGPLEAPRSYEGEAVFANLGVKAYRKLPGFTNVSGTVTVDSRGGSVSLSGRDSAFDLPLVLRYPLGFDRLDAAANWRVRDGRLHLALTRVEFANPDVAGAVSGSYESVPGGPGKADLTGALSRANAQAVHLYLPRLIGEHTHDWLRDALTAGAVSDVKLRLKGDLANFPFANDQGGIFQVTAKGQGIALNYAPGWPAIEGLAATVEFRGKRMEIAARGMTSNVRLPRVKAVIPDLIVYDEVLQLEGEAQGATADVLRFINASPVAEWLDQFTAETTAAGAGRLALRMTLPLRKAGNTRVAGSYQFFNNDIRLAPDIPPLRQVTGRLDFTESSVSAQRIATEVLGGPATLSVATLPDHSLRVKAGGRMTAAGLAEAYPGPFTRALKGTSDWSLGIGLRKKRANLSFVSDLQGMESTLPAPFGKAAATRLPLRIERRMLDAQHDSVSLALGEIVSAQLARQLTGSAMQVQRGTVRFGGVAAAPVHPGVWVDGELPYLDLDAWRALLADGAGGPTGVPLAGVHLRLGVFDFLGRRFNGLHLNAWAQGERWQATLDGAELAGEASWRSGGGGKLTARMKRIAFPDPAPERGVAPAGGRDLELPALDIAVDELEVRKLKLGRLDLQAAKQGSDWRIDRLRLSNPDAVFNASGNWQSWLAQPSTRLDVDLEVKDLGRFLARMGHPDRIRRGNARLAGEVAWRGGPAAFNIATLSGKLQLEAHSGQFLKIEPGIGKLLGLLSLQSLPRRLTLDFRDVFSEGFAFDNIAGTTTITNGVAATNDFVMQGPAAVVGLSGVTDLAKETQNLRIRVVPGVGEGVAVAGAFLGGPIVGVTAFVLQKLLKDPVGQMISYEYQVTGTWDNPQAVRIAQEAPEVSP